MADRTVVVRLRAEVNDFRSKMDQAARSALQVSDAAVRGSQKSAAALSQQQKTAKSSADAWEGLKTTATVAGGAMVAGFALAAKATMDFDKQMSAVKAATQATSGEMDKLRAAAMEAGARTQYSATEAAAAIENLSKAGISTADILDGALNGALDLAAAGSLDVADAAEIAATTITQFGLKGSDMAHVADLLAAGAGKAQGDVQDLAQALQYVGTSASQMGVSVEETTGALALLASNGQLADRAGTGLRGVLMALTSPSSIAASTMEQYGITIYDAQGKFIGLSGVAGQLKSHLGGLDEATRNQALGQIFGNAQIETARILYKGGAEAVNEWTGKVNDQGYAARVAGDKMDNLAGDLERLKGSLETTFIKGGSGSTGALRFFTQTAEKFVDVIGAMPGPVLGVATALTGLGGAALLLAPRVLAVKTALSTMSPAAQGAAKSAALGTAKFLAFAAAAGIANDALTTKVNDQGLAADIEKFAKSGEIGGEAAKVFGDDMGKLKGDLSFMLTPNWYDGATKGVGKITSALGMFSTEGDVGQQIQKVDAALADLASRDPAAASAAFDRIKSAASDAGVPINELTTLFPAYTAAANGSTSGSDAAASSVKSVGEAAQKAGGDVDEFAKQLEAMIAPGMAASKAADEQKNALDKLAESAKANGTKLDGNSTAARANRDAVRGAIESNVSLATAYARLTGSVDQGKAKYDEASDALVRAGVKAGFSEGAMRRFLASMGAVGQAKVDPKIGADDSALKAKLDAAKAKLAHLRTLKTSPKVEADITAAKRDVANAQKALNNFRQRNKPGVGVNNEPARAGINAAIGWGENWAGKTFWATLKTKAFLGGAVGAARDGGQVRGFDHGGTVRGAGTKTSDDIPAWLSNGEYVIRAASVDKYGTELFDRLNAGKYSGGGPTARKAYTNKKTYDQKFREWNARNDAYNAAVNARNDRIAARDSVASSRTSAVEASRSTFRGQSGVMTFDFAAYESARNAAAAATQAEADAENALFEARRKANTSSKADKPQALRDLADAQRKYADAKKASAEATDAEAKAKPTSANILANFQERVSKMQGFAGNLRTLAAWGMPSILLAEILNSGLESGSQMAAALVEGGAGNIAQFQSLAIAQTNAGTDLGNLNAAWNPGAGDVTLDQELGSANAAIGAPIRDNRGAKPTYKKPGKKRRAFGGPVLAGEPYLVGEQGMEMFVPGVSGSIVSARNLQHAISAGSVSGHDGASAPLRLEMPGYGEFWSGLVTYNRRTGFSLRALDGS